MQTSHAKPANPERPRRRWLLLPLLALVTMLAGACEDEVVAEPDYPYAADSYYYYGYYPAPAPGMTWIEGRWIWGGARWNWTRGYWVHPQPGFVWTRGRYWNGRGHRRFAPGRWRRR